MIRPAAEVVSQETLAGQRVRDRQHRWAVAVAFGFLGLVLTASSAHGQITIVSGNNQSAPINTRVPNPLVVSINCSGSDPVIPQPCGTVTWTSTAAGDNFSPNPSLTSGSPEGATSSTVLTLGSTPGSRTVTARSGALAESVTFTITGTPASVASTPLATANLTPPALSVATALDVSCGQATGTFQSLCNQILALPAVQQPAALQSLAPTQIAAQAPTALQAQTVQLANINARIVALRTGATGFSLSGLSLGALTNAVAANALASPDVADDVSAAQRPSFSRLGGFINGLVSFGDQDRTDREPGFDVRAVGVTGGIDYRFTDNFVLGGAVGYAGSDVDFDASAGTLETHGWTVTLFGTYEVNGFYVDGSGTYGRTNYETERRIEFPGFAARADGDTSGSQYALAVGTGYNFRWRALTIGPYARVEYIRIDVDGFEEKGADAANLRIGSQDITSVTTNFGAQASYAISVPWGVLTPYVRGDWEHEYRNGSRVISARFVADPVQTQFGIPTEQPDRDYFNLGGGASAQFRRGMAAFLDYETVLGLNRASNHQVTAGLRFEF